MCGILGVFALGGELGEPADLERRLKKGLSVQAYRGPDARAVRLWPERGLGLGHLRLSILDLAERANQPMSSDDGSVVVAYNGEIYNFRSLRRELEGAGRRFVTESDTEVLIEGYRHWGLDGLLPRLAGMFAFALHDAQARTLWLVRDRPGKKPLYWTEAAGKVFFASEPQALFELLPGRPGLSKTGLEAFLALKFVPPPQTLFEGVMKLAPGQYLEASPSGTKVVSYWSPLGRGAAPAEGLEDRLDAAISVAAERRLVSDVPVCVFLSGGIDSSLIVDKTGRAGQRLVAYTIGYDDMPGYNEFEYARQVAAKYPLDYREIRLKSADVLDVLQDDALVFSEPITDWVWVPLHFLSRQARADRYKVALLGEGSDELFFGYDVMLKGLEDLRRFSSAGWRALAAAGYALGGPVYRVSRRGHRTYDLWRRAAEGSPVYWGSSIGFPATQRHQLAGPALGEPRSDPAARFVAELYRDYAERAVDPTDLANLVCYVELRSKMSEVLLQRVDRVTMRHSIEARSPFVDHELCELAFSIPGAWKIPGGELKGLLKKVASRHLPEGVVRRKKMGFSFPFKEWLRGPLGAAVEGAFAKSRLFSDGWVDGAFARALLKEHRAGWADHAPRLWMLYSLARWYDAWLA